MRRHSTCRPRPTINVEDMEMAVFPSHRRLDRTVKVSEGHCVEHEQPAPYGRLGSEQRHLDAKSGPALVFGALVLVTVQMSIVASVT